MDTKNMSFLNTHVNNLSLDEITCFFDESIRTGQWIHTVSLNVDQIVKIENNKYFRQIVDDAELVITDGTPILWVSRLIGKPIKYKYPGPDLTEQILKHCSIKGYSVFFLGAADGVAEKAAENMRKKYTGLRIAGTYSPPYGFEKDKDEINKINNILIESSADILIVGLSAPKQEKFVYENRNIYQIPISLSVGAAIDFMAGNVKRAPSWVNRCGLEWLYRFLKEPKRLFKRYFVNDLQFFRIVYKYRK